MKRAILLEELGKATDKAAAYALERGFPIPISKKSTVVGNLFVEKNNNGLYNVLKFDKHVLYKDISVFDIAVIIAQKYNVGESSAIKQVLYLEGVFTKYHLDMIHYLHVMKNAKKKNDNDRVAILEDKFRMAEMSAKNARNKIINFKIVR